MTVPFDVFYIILFLGFTYGTVRSRTGRYDRSSFVRTTDSTRRASHGKVASAVLGGVYIVGLPARDCV